VTVSEAVIVVKCQVNNFAASSLKQ